MFADILRYGNLIHDNVKAKVLSYLQEKAVSYPDNRRGKHQEDGEAFLPQVHDVVAYVGSDQKIHLAHVTEVISKNVARIIIVKNGKVEEVTSHISLLKLIYRPHDGNNFLDLTVAALRV